MNNKTYTGKGSSDEINGEPIVMRPDTIVKPEALYFISSLLTEDVQEGKLAPERKSICGDFVYENTLTHFFSRTNYGKSIFAFQLAYAAATGTSIDECAALKNHCEPMKVLFFDLEMDAKTISDRHSQAVNNADPNLDNLIFMRYPREQALKFGYELLDLIEFNAIKNQAKLIIIDNISCLLPESIRSDFVTFVVTRLRQIRDKTGAAVFVIGHTTKEDPRIAVKTVSYYGSAKLQDLTTEIFYLDKTKDGKFFLRHAKTKHKECHDDTVPVFTLNDQHPKVGLGFTFERLQNLADIQLPSTLEHDRSRRKLNLNNYTREIEILLNNGVNVSVVADIFGVDRRTIYRVTEDSRLSFKCHK